MTHSFIQPPPPLPPPLPLLPPSSFVVQAVTSPVEHPAFARHGSCTLGSGSGGGGGSSSRTIIVREHCKGDARGAGGYYEDNQQV